jgi:hypothetical protein
MVEVRNGVEEGGSGGGGAAGDVAEHAHVLSWRPLRHPLRHAASPEPEAEGLLHGPSRALLEAGDWESGGDADAAWTWTASEQSSRCSATQQRHRRRRRPVGVVAA